MDMLYVQPWMERTTRCDGCGVFVQEPIIFDQQRHVCHFDCTEAANV